MNQRYQKYGKPEGKTRKSAASAKPKRAGSTSNGSSSSSGSSSKGKVVFVAPPEYKKWRNIWIVLFAVSFTIALASFLLRSYIPRQAMTYLLVVCYAMLGAGVYIDMKKVRPLRRAGMVVKDK